MIDYPDWALAIVRPGVACPTDDTAMGWAVALADAALRHEGGPFGAVIVDESRRVLSLGWNRVIAGNDPTAHAEAIAIRHAATARSSWHLGGLHLVTSCAPCVMCTGAVHWAGIATVVAGARTADAEAVGFIEGPPGFDPVAFLRARGVTFVADVRRDEAVAVLQRYGGVVYNG